VSRPCSQPGCEGSVGADDYCDTCGTRAWSEQGRTVAASESAPTSLTGSRGTLVTGSARSGGMRRRSRSARTSAALTSLGGGLTDMAPVSPRRAVPLRQPVVHEESRFCALGHPVGRSRPGKPGRTAGFCPTCGQPFDFEPKLEPGEIVGGQYEVAGCLAHGGLGWVYLAFDKAVDDRPVVLKGLLDSQDPAAMAVAVAEKRFLAEIHHPNIVGIHNFVTHRRAGYIVMEYVGGRSLKELLEDRREANGGRPDPMPVDQAISYVRAILPAFRHLHQRALVYCDFKPENLIHVGDQVKLIDLGALRRIDDRTSDIYGTAGFQAPEIAEDGVSVPSDLYTIGRTLAVLTLDFRGYQSKFRLSIPDPADHPALSRFDSFHRFLLKATAHHPDDRFQSAEEMDDQLLGVLREVVALESGRPQPAPSVVFAQAIDDQTLPQLAVDPADPAAAFLTNLPADTPEAVLQQIDDAITAAQVAESVEIQLHRAKALIDVGDLDGAARELDKVEGEDPWEWRADWLRGVAAHAARDGAAAVAAFDRCWSEVPGELAPKLALALAFEQPGDLEVAAALHDLVVSTDPSYVAAARGLARCRAQAGDVGGALDALGRIPSTHLAYPSAQLEAVELLIAAGRYPEAATRLQHLQVDAYRRAELEVALAEAALGDGRQRHGHGASEERRGRADLEKALRALARLTPDAAKRSHLVDRANGVRPLTLL
jgi:serine/threonine-protein kinase PknG